MSKFKFELYITGNSLRSEVAIRSIRSICDELLKDNFTLDVIDVLETPELAEKEKVLATPTLIKRVPPPIRRLVGDLSNTDVVKHYLDL